MVKEFSIIFIIFVIVCGLGCHRLFNKEEDVKPFKTYLLMKNNDGNYTIYKNNTMISYCQIKEDKIEIRYGTKFNEYIEKKIENRNNLSIHDLMQQMTRDILDKQGEKVAWVNYVNDFNLSFESSLDYNSHEFNNILLNTILDRELMIKMLKEYNNIEY